MCLRSDTCGGCDMELMIKGIFPLFMVSGLVTVTFGICFLLILGCRSGDSLWKF